MRQPTQPSLFDTEPVDASSLIAIEAQREPLTKAQQLFNRLVDKIRVQRAALQHWQEFVLRHQQRLAAELEPLHRELLDVQRQLVRRVHDILTGSAPGKGQALGRNQRNQLTRLLLELVESVLLHAPDAEMEALYDEHSSVSLAEQRREELELTEAFLGDLFGEDALRGHAADNADDLLRHARQKMQTRAEQEAIAREAKKDAKRQARATKRGRPHAADQALDKQQQAAKEASQSVREVYRKLASALHPDRSADAADHERRTALMKRVNQAYDGNDLLGLLTIQIEIEQIDAEHMARVPSEQLAHYNQVLREQLAQLEAEVQSLVAPFAFTLDLAPAQIVASPALVERALRDDIATARHAVAQLRGDLAAFGDPQQLRQRLKDMARSERDATAEEYDMSLDDFDALLAQMESAAPPRRARRRR